jgi:multidrug/hemolysin transport system ATP-binding protein
VKSYILEVEHLSKRFDKIQAVDDVSFKVAEDSLFAILGPNGAGKSTLIKLLIGLLHLDKGNIKLDNQTSSTAIRSKIGVVFQDNILDDLLSVKENLLTHGTLFFNSKKLALARYEEIVTFLKLKDIENSRFGLLSGGQKRRVEIGRAIFNQPKILFLDEPTTGLDPENRKQVWNVINELKDKYHTSVILTTHYMEEASTAAQIIIIKSGKIIANGSPLELKQRYSQDSLKILPNNENELLSYLKSKQLKYLVVDKVYVLEVTSTKQTLNIISDVKDNIASFEVIKGTLEDVFLNCLNGVKHD